jgi:hypothetical protein
MTKMSNNHYCGECRWMLYEDTDGDGFCGLNSEGMAEVPVRCDKRACKGFEPQQDGNTCGECLLFETEDGSPYCLAKDLYTSAYAEDQACEDFIEKQNDNEN